MKRRRLTTERLDARQLLAGDVTCGIEMTDEVSAESSALFRAADAGSTRDTAANIGVVDGQASLPGSLGFFDRRDTIAFEVDQAASVDLVLGSLRRDADLYLSDADGNLLERSIRGGRSNDQIFVDLEAGQYFITVVAQSYWSNRYVLSITTEIHDAPLDDPLGNPEQDNPEQDNPEQDNPEQGNPEQGDPGQGVGGDPTTSDPVDDGSSDPSVGEDGESGDTSPPTNSNPSLAEVPNYGNSRDWNLNQIAAPEAWSAGYTGEGITVAVVDTGVDLDHPDLVTNLYVNPGEIPGNGIDDDGNGYIDDVSGYDFADNDSNPNDVNGHGTHVAGTIAASRNGVGATGVAPDAKIIPVRVLGNDGSGNSNDVAEGIRYAASLGADIINLSLGGGYSSAIDRAIEYAEALGSIIVAAAGNESAAVPSFPARFSASDSNVISVGAVDRNDRSAGFSNAVGNSGAVQIDAPGVGIYSTYVGGRYATLSGTSMAAPHVAGLAALTLSANPDLTTPELRDLLTRGTDGQASGSDAIGLASAQTTVAYAAAGLTIDGNSTGAVNTQVAQSSNRVRATASFIDSIDEDKKVTGQFYGGDELPA